VRKGPKEIVENQGFPKGRSNHEKGKESIAQEKKKSESKKPLEGDLERTTKFQGGRKRGRVQKEGNFSGLKAFNGCQPTGREKKKTSGGLGSTNERERESRKKKSRHSTKRHKGAGKDSYGGPC